MEAAVAQTEARTATAKGTPPALARTQSLAGVAMTVAVSAPGIASTATATATVTGIAALIGTGTGTETTGGAGAQRERMRVATGGDRETVINSDEYNSA